MSVASASQESLRRLLGKGRRLLGQARDGWPPTGRFHEVHLRAVAGCLILLLGALTTAIVTKSSGREADPRSQRDLALRGVTISGGEFGSVNTADNSNTYVSGAESDLPTLAELQYLRGRGIRYVRVAFRQERVQPSFQGPLNAEGVADVRQVLNDARAAGLLVNIDWHNYARFWVGATELILGSDQYPITHFVDFHAKVAAAFGEHPSLHALSLTNEPHDLPDPPASSQGGSTWEQASRAAVLAGRAAGYKGWYSVAADGWSGAQTIDVSHPGGWWIRDPLKRSFVEVHYYPDRDNVGHFTRSYQDEEAHSRSMGFASHSDRVQKELGRAAAWCARSRVACYLGETGWMQSRRRLNGNPAGEDEAAAWNDQVANVIFKIADRERFHVTVFTAGAYPRDFETLAYDLETFSTTSMSAVIESHLTIAPRP